ncbi:bacterial peptide chain release factor 2 (bRF-2) [Desulfovibrio litoralis DSM 11393]|uniref:Peptide chain release factor 2 n=1 Tax=Desulfovibrio litoralis DSM 11393 TaxID=1121455 RepID=A0A1M7S6Q9_9BACT|nr:bacterial peptide chain release factor 2 (bRF-2) [Desulfovibrio litoralis DSM 11393]
MPYGVDFDNDKLEKRLKEIDNVISLPDAWENPEKLTPILQEKSHIETQLSDYKALYSHKTDLEDWLNLAEDDDDEILINLDSSIKKLNDAIAEMELALLLSNKEDEFNALLEIHPGAGGTEAQDWAEMLLRMYLRWADRHNFKTEYLDYLSGDEAGIKSVTLRISGHNVYGFLKHEKGIHRLIRISPFDSSGRRHTSFASVDVLPDVGQDIQIDIKETDLRIDVFRSSGPGGQSVNTTSSAVRVTHIPTGIVAQCQNEKSQHHNKESALQILKSRLYELELQKIEDEKKAQYAGKNAIGFGSQIRTYTMQPYRLVKDHRSNTEIGDVEAVLDGSLDTLIKEQLLRIYGQKK